MERLIEMVENAYVDTEIEEMTSVYPEEPNATADRNEVKLSMPSSSEDQHRKPLDAEPPNLDLKPLLTDLK